MATNDSTVSVQLSRGKFALVDKADEHLVERYIWQAQRCASGLWYAVTNQNVGGVTKQIRMHRLLLGISDPEQWVDHKDGDGLNNCRGNIRPATRSENAQNSRKRSKTHAKGVYQDRDRWRAQITVNKTRHRLGSFETEAHAAAAYEAASKRLHGEWSRVDPVELPSPETLKTERVFFALTKRDHAKFVALGGVKWIRGLVASS